MEHLIIWSLDVASMVRVICVTMGLQLEETAYQYEITLKVVSTLPFVQDLQTPAHS